MAHEFPFGAFGSQEQDFLSDVLLPPKIFRWNNLWSRDPFTFQANFPETFS